MNFAPMPLRLETERLILTPENEQDAPWFCQLLNERGTHLFTLEETREHIAAMTATMTTTGIGALVIRTKHDGEAIGYCAIIVGRGSLEEPEIAYELLPQAHGHGYATEAGQAMVEAAFGTGRTRIWSTVGSWNTPSLRVLEKLDFREDHVTQEPTAGEVIWLVRER
jgi:RimJ/RimL family protein N-acetyltransferase